MRARVRRLALGFGLATLGVLSGCASGWEGVPYLWQSVDGHLDLLRRARPIEEVIADPTTAAETIEKLRYARRARAFAADALGLPRNGSYTRFAALDRDFVLWNVFAAPELSLQLERWCFPVAGCIGYRGYYHRADALGYADSLRARGLDVRVGGVPAYSTLGWFDDPITSAMLRYPKSEIARLVFHELAHQVVYVKGDTTFNESFATAVEKLGIERWLAHEREHGGDLEEEARYRRFQARRLAFIALLQETRNRLANVYDDASLDDPARRVAKEAILAQLRSDYESMKRDAWQGWSGYDRWFDDRVGNAHLAAVGAYHDRVDAFLALFASHDGDFARFFAAVRELATLPAADRDERLRAMQRGPGH
ncbi:MAG: aminopeptidase [Burkholderiaceae bacterium]